MVARRAVALLALVLVVPMVGTIFPLWPPGSVAPYLLHPLVTQETDPAIVGRWEQPFDGQVPAVNLVVLPNGRVLYWSGVDSHAGPTLPFLLDIPAPAQARVLDLSGTSPVVTTPSPSDGGAGDMFCSGQTVLPDGRVLVVGGSAFTTLLDPDGWHVYGLNTARTFDPATNTWTRHQDMVGWRWYPSIIGLPDGKALVASGIQDLANPLTHNTLLERYDPATDKWSQLPESASKLLPLYARLHVVPSGPLKGDVLYNPVGCLWCPFGETPLEGPWSFAQSLDLGTNEWAMHDAALLGVRQHAAVVLLTLEPPEYRPVFLTVGGTLQRMTVATNTVELADYSSLPPERELASPMTFPRWHLNTVLLPTGEVLAVGGGLIDNVMAYSAPNEPVLAAEIYDPDTTDPTTGLQGTWTMTQEMEVPRMYHSTAVLLPDARVLVGGHVPLPNIQQVLPQVNEKRLEIYDPPYLFHGPRPVLESVPDHVGYGEAFNVGTPDAATVGKAVLIRPGSTTHSWDSDQRAIALDITSRSEGRLTLVAPPDGDVAAPGHYMLFLLQDHGQGPVPSVAKFVRLG